MDVTEIEVDFDETELFILFCNNMALPCTNHISSTLFVFEPQALMTSQMIA